MKNETPDPARDGRLLHVTQRQFWGSLAAALVIFVFATGPLWRHAADIARLDHAIYWSYAAIPFLIGGCLLWSKNWSWRGFLLDTLALTLTKYVVTCSVAIAFWAAGADPQRVATVPPPKPASPARQEPSAPPTVIDPARTGRVVVTVVDAGGHPIAGAHAYVAKGLEGLVFAPPSAPVLLTNDGHGVTPRVVVAQTGQTLEGRSTDGRLHTLVVRRDGAALFNVPLLSSGAPTVARTVDTPGLATVRCNVHPGAEKESLLLLVTHPFHGDTDAEGQVAWSGVPAGRLAVAAMLDGGETPRAASVTVVAGAIAHVRLVLDGS